MSVKMQLKTGEFVYLLSPTKNGYIVKHMNGHLGFVSLKMIKGL